MKFLRSILQFLRSPKKANTPSLLVYSIAASTAARCYTKHNE